MVKHTKMHTSEKNSKCNEGDHLFSAQNNLETHIMAQDGETKFQCDQCDKNYSKKGI